MGRWHLPHVHSSSPLQVVFLHSSDIAARLPETRQKHAASAVPAPVESNLRLAPRSPSPRLARLCLLAPHTVLCRVQQRKVLVPDLLKLALKPLLN